MESPQKPSPFDAKPIESLPEKPVTDKDATDIKGGALLRGGDDDLEDLEIEYRR